MTRKLLFAMLCLVLIFGACAEGLIVERIPDCTIESINVFDSNENNIFRENEVSHLNGNASLTDIDSDFRIVGTTLIEYTGFGGNVQIPDGVKIIGNGAFYGCKDLKSVYIPNSVEHIGDAAFCDCYELENINIPENVVTIGERAFECCFVLDGVSIPDGVSVIEEHAFYCTALTNISIPSSVKSIGTGAFYSCSDLRNLTLHNGITAIGMYAFSDCTSITSLSIPRSVDTIDELAFSGCYSITDVYIDSNNVFIADDAYDKCYSIKVFHTHCETPATKWAREHGYNVVTTEHVAVKDKAVEPTYVKTGLTAGSHCSVCGTVLEVQKIVPELVAKKVKLNSKKATLTVGKSLQLKATLTPAHKTSSKVKLKWSTSNGKVATVSAKGKVKAVGAGKATITVVTPNGKKATCKITVKAKKK